MIGMFRVGIGSAAGALLLTVGLWAAPQAPPGFNVHMVQENDGRRFWRGGAPRKDTLQALAVDARARRVTVTFVDLRTPPNRDDRSGKGGRLSPAGEQKLAAQLGLRYRAVSALDPNLTTKLKSALAAGDVYMHCMYGVNRTGFATARYARSAHAAISREGLGKHDWARGEAFEARRARD